MRRIAARQASLWRVGMSALCQKQTCARQNNASLKYLAFWQDYRRRSIDTASLNVGLGPPPGEIGHCVLSSGHDRRCRTQVEHVALDLHHARLGLPQPVREERHKHGMRQGLFFLSVWKGPL